MDKIEAQKLVEECLEGKLEPHNPVECVILENETIEKDWGWVFFYQSKAFIKSNNFIDMLAGTAPYIVNKHTGKITLTGTAHPIEYYIQEYEKTLPNT